MNRHALGKFITLEGIDGAGKSTHLPWLKSWWEQRGWQTVQTREPGGTPLAEKIREMVLGQEMDALTESLMMFAARRDHIKNAIQPALDKGHLVICDRFTDASFAYQGFGRGHDLTVLNTLEAWTQEGLQPDLTLWFDVEPAIASQRRSAAREADRFEQLDQAFFERVRQGYLERFKNDPKRLVRIDASQTPEEIQRWLNGFLSTLTWA